MKPLSFSLPGDLELERKITLKQVSEITTLSEDTLRREHSDKILKLSPKRRGMKLRDALALGGSK